ncbi:hypothetical protein [Sphingomonas bacterium]|uniref:hypothetical protein n=1 Tax=Sphingomonas bacterium TaxID=1895847 RepID=UPI00262B8D26|nr:hypothetical protein [Sphingomonas bacterium]
MGDRRRPRPGEHYTQSTGDFSHDPFTTGWIVEIDPVWDCKGDAPVANVTALFDQCRAVLIS